MCPVVPVVVARTSFERFVRSKRNAIVFARTVASADEVNMTRTSCATSTSVIARWRARVRTASAFRFAVLRAFLFERFYSFANLRMSIVAARENLYHDVGGGGGRESARHDGNDDDRHVVQAPNRRRESLTERRIDA